MQRLSFYEEEKADGLYLPGVSLRSSPLMSPWSFLSLRRRSFSYDKIIQVPFQITIVKLDGSCFGIEVEAAATIADLKQAVERVFSHMPVEGPGKISWRHLWGHFCLSYEGQKLLDDDEFIRVYGIKDGDHLHFVRHVAFTYNLVKKRSGKRLNPPKLHRRKNNYIMNNRQVEEDEDHDLENLGFGEHRHCNEDLALPIKCLVSRMFRDLFYYSRASSVGNMRLEAKAYPSRLTDRFFGHLRSIFCLHSGSSPALHSGSGHYARKKKLKGYHFHKYTKMSTCFGGKPSRIN